MLQSLPTPTTSSTIVGATTTVTVAVTPLVSLCLYVTNDGEHSLVNLMHNLFVALYCIAICIYVAVVATYDCACVRGAVNK